MTWAQIMNTLVPPVLVLLTIAWFTGVGWRMLGGAWKYLSYLIFIYSIAYLFTSYDGKVIPVAQQTPHTLDTKVNSIQEWRTAVSSDPTVRKIMDNQATPIARDLAQNLLPYAYSSIEQTLIHVMSGDFSDLQGSFASSMATFVTCTYHVKGGQDILNKFWNQDLQMLIADTPLINQLTKINFSRIGIPAIPIQQCYDTVVAP